MSNKLFISHNARDKALADIISNTIKEISIQQITAWFSSDDNKDGGFNFGDDWYKKIMDRIDECEILVALLTPNSIDRPWLYFEAGIAKGKNKIIIPVCVGIKRENIKSPLNVLQACQATDKKSLNEFLEKTLKTFGYPLDKKNFGKVLSQTALSISKHTPTTKSKGLNAEELIDNIKTHFDQKLFELTKTKSIKSKRLVSNLDAYSIKFSFYSKSRKREFITEINDSDTFQDVTNSIYFNFQDVMEPFTYLEKWIIIDNSTGDYLIIREIADRIQAKTLLLKDRDYSIKKLNKPYSAIDSKKRILAK